MYSAGHITTRWRWSKVAFWDNQRTLVAHLAGAGEEGGCKQLREDLTGRAAELK